MACVDDVQVTAYLDGQLADPARRQIAAHAETCARCHDLLAAAHRRRAITDSTVAQREETGGEVCVQTPTVVPAAEDRTRATAGAAGGVIEGANPWAYRLDAHVGSGGMGTVYRATDVQLGRTVALKLQQRADGDEPGREDPRFLREALITARLQHPSIVPVYQAGRAPDGEVFYTMKLISGYSLREKIDQASTLEEQLALLPHVLAAADAIAYAHSQHVIHRDIKPANIMVGPFGETWLIDWGLAKELDAPDPVGLPGAAAPTVETVAGTVMGTPAYMAPEQAAGRAAAEPGDVYALGAVLYHVLSRRPPYAGKSSDEVLREVRTQKPPPLEQLQPRTPIELCTIVERAMARDEGARYPTAGALADDLRRFLTGQLVRAHDYSAATLVRRWVARHRAAVAVAAVLLSLLSASAILSTRRIVRERAAAEARRDELILAQARAALDRDPTAAVAWLKSYPESGADLRGLRDLTIDAAGRGVAQQLLPTQGPLMVAGFTRDGAQLVTASRLGSVRRWDPLRGSELAHHQIDGPTAGALSPDARTVALGLEAGGVYVVGDAGVVKSPAPHARGMVERMLFSPDGTQVASAGDDGTVRLWNLGSGGVRVLAGHRAEVLDLAFAPDGRHLASAGNDKTVRWWNVASGSADVLSTAAAPLLVVAAPDNAQVAFAQRGGNDVGLWQPALGRTRTLRGHHTPVSALAFAPAGDVLVTGAHDGELRAWDLATGSSRVLRAVGSTVWTLQFAHDGHRFAAGDADGGLALWDLADGSTRALRGHRDGVATLAFSADDKLLVSGGNEGQARVWRLEPQGRVLVGHTGAIEDLRFSADGRHLLSASRDATVRVWPSDGGAPRVLRDHDIDLHDARFLPDGRVVSSGEDGTLRLWDPVDEDSRILGRHEGGILHMLATPDGALVVTGGRDQTVRLWTVADGSSRVLRGQGCTVYELALAPDGQLWSLGVDGRVLHWDLQRGVGQPIDPDVAHEHVGWLPGTLALTTDHAIKLASADGVVSRVLAYEAPVLKLTNGELFAVASGSEIYLHSTRSPERRLIATRMHVTFMAFSADARLFAAAADDGRIYLWRVADGAAAIAGHDRHATMALALSPDGSLVADGAMDGAIWLRPTAEVPLLALDHRAVRAALDELTSATLTNVGEP